MATVISMIEMKAAESDQRAVQESLNDIGQRLRSMGLVYQALAGVADNPMVSLDSFLPSLIDLIVDSYDLEAHVKVVCTAEKVIAPARIAFSVGVIVNELVTNAVKHAFPDGRSGTITVAMDRPDAESARLIVSDDGAGVQGDRSGFGTMMIETLIRQIQGSIERIDDAGTNIVTRFPCAPTDSDGD